jgi:DNA-binding response OmpR family regulator
MDTEDQTGRLMINFARVLLVHDDAFDMSALYEALKKKFIVRVVTSVDAAVDLARATPFDCVVCASGGVIRAREIHDRLVSERSGPASRFLFLRAQSSDDDDAVFFLTSGKTWLALPVVPDDVVDAIYVTCK